MIKRLIPIALFFIVLALTVSCQTAESGSDEEAVPETVIETVEVERQSPYTYELLRGMSDTNNYIDDPAMGHSIAFASIDDSLSYSQLVLQSLQDEWMLAGGSRDSLLLLDNMSDDEKALENAGQAFDAEAEVLIYSYSDKGINAVIGSKAAENGIYMIAVDAPVPGYPVMGIDNYMAGALAGQWAADAIEMVYGGWDNVDRVIYLYPADTDGDAALRIYGSEVELAARFGDDVDSEKADSRAVEADNVMTGQDSGKVIQDLMELYPEDGNIVVFCLNDSVAEGVYMAAADSGRWDADKWLIISQGLDERGKELVTEGIIDADVAFFPEKYGKYLVPAALAHIYENPVPPYISMENTVITADNIGQYY